MRKLTSFIQIAVMIMLAMFVSVSLVSSAVRIDTSALLEAVTVEGVRAHQAAFQAAADANGGIRESSTPGYFASVDYVAGKMVAAGYIVTVQEFDYPFFEELQPAELEQVAPVPTVYPYFNDAGFATMEYSGSGDVTAIAEGVDLFLPPADAANTSTSGCEPEDFDGFTPGNIAVIQRGTCDFVVKAMQKCPVNIQIISIG